ncbi:unnamed protein product, partial [Prorocentrum cordatum]
MAAPMVAVGSDLGTPSNRQLWDYYHAMFATIMPKGRQWTCLWILLSVVLNGHLLDPVAISQGEVTLSLRRQALRVPQLRDYVRDLRDHIQDADAAYPGPVRTFVNMPNQLNWRWPSFDILMTDLGAPISWLEGHSDFLMHHLRDSQRRWFQGKVPTTRNDLGDVAKHKYGIDMDMVNYITDDENKRWMAVATIKIAIDAKPEMFYIEHVYSHQGEAVGAPEHLVQFTTGYAETGSALVASADKVIFVGSVGVGKKVMEAASKTLTPVILELGGKARPLAESLSPAKDYSASVAKHAESRPDPGPPGQPSEDPFVVCDDADPKEIAQLAVRSNFQNMGQNCVVPERFIVYEKVYDDFCEQISSLVRTMKQAPPLSSDFVDCGACVHPPSLEGYQRFVDDAVAKGARVLAGGGRNKEFPDGQFFQPTVLADVTEDMLIAKEETFGPILSIFKVKGNSDDEAVRIANNCAFALGSCAMSADQARAARICARLE